MAAATPTATATRTRISRSFSPAASAAQPWSASAIPPDAWAMFESKNKLMKRILLSIFLALASLVRSQAGAGVPGVVSPEVHADRTVTFRIAAPKATDVTITCDWLDGAQKLTNADNGIWSV